MSNVDPRVWPEVKKQRKLSKSFLDASQMLFEIGSILRRSEVPHDSRPMQRLIKLAEKIEASGAEFLQKNSSAHGISDFFETLSKIYSRPEVDELDKQLIVRLCEHWGEHFKEKIDHTFLFDVSLRNEVGGARELAAIKTGDWWGVSKSHVYQTAKMVDYGWHELPDYYDMDKGYLFLRRQIGLPKSAANFFDMLIHSFLQDYVGEYDEKYDGTSDCLSFLIDFVYEAEHEPHMKDFLKQNFKIDVDGAFAEYDAHLATLHSIASLYKTEKTEKTADKLLNFSENSVRRRRGPQSCATPTLSV